MWNPLRSFPRNAKCVCLSGKKWKNCCLAKQPMTVKATADAVDALKTVQVVRKSLKHIRSK